MYHNLHCSGGHFPFPVGLRTTKHLQSANSQSYRLYLPSFVKVGVVFCCDEYHAFIIPLKKYFFNTFFFFFKYFVLFQCHFLIFLLSGHVRKPLPAPRGNAPVDTLCNPPFYFSTLSGIFKKATLLFLSLFIVFVSRRNIFSFKIYN